MLEPCDKTLLMPIAKMGPMMSRRSTLAALAALISRGGAGQENDAIEEELRLLVFFD